ncbi:flagellar hook-basal body complex protein [Desulfurivibrio alkaliphilus]|uniref:Flagellar hook protein FlgE n=1 Tax=Desulfurivibrio alkaliphilus (strain DSM 19089 / UNIQEM U267 / AHT2) TaxID=589865 RepID=D6Z2V3_DESAT|nr:flagellar hook-basal body complex protein [Desulfurivibrio alkaliphilus]ADH85878.1 fagellar hook-basal body protein [Desulfurivibrio alkaliphilus AHT 2]
MSLSGSLYAGISGLSTMGNGMSVLGDNIANVNTVAFNSSRSTFQDVLSQSVSTAAGTAQVGRGVTLTTVDGLFAQGSFESTSTPTDMAIGGEGFFMLRGGDSAEADMFTRAGEFRFDQHGFLTSPGGHFVQGWSVDKNTGQIEGTIGDIRMDRSTPPVQTEQIDLIVNLDARVDQASASTLYDSWNGTADDPIAATNYQYTTSLKVYDSKGVARDVTIYFDRTAKENEWEFLVTSDPAADRRELSEAEKQTYAPDEQYNYQNPAHRGAGALMYGKINFDNNGNITTIDTWDVPADGRVDPDRTTNRSNRLDDSGNYPVFDANFTGDPQTIALNFGARSDGSSLLPQILVSHDGAIDITTDNPITTETRWRDVRDSEGRRIIPDDYDPNLAADPSEDHVAISVTGFDHEGRPVSLTYEIPDRNTRLGADGEFLSQLANQFGAVSAGIDADGRLTLRAPGGASRMAITGIDFVDAIADFTTVNPFGSGAVNVSSTKKEVVAPVQTYSAPYDTTTDTDPPSLISAATRWDAVYVDGNPDPAIDFDGDPAISYAIMTRDGTLLEGEYSNFEASPDSTVQGFLDHLSNEYDVDAYIDNTGRLVIRDRVADPGGDEASQLNFRIMAYTDMEEIFGPADMDDFGDFHVISGSPERNGSQTGTAVDNRFGDTEAMFTTQYANSSTTIYQDQNGFAAGFLQSVSVDTAGIITGNFSNGQVLMQAKVALADFANLQGLHKVGGNIFRATTQSGAPVTGEPGTNGLGEIAPNSLEMSNVDLGTEFVKMITTQRGFQANSKMITTTDEMLNELINIKR